MTSDCLTSRRNFLKTSLLGGAAALAAWRLRPAWAAQAAPAAAGKFTSRVALTAGNDRANLAFQALEPFRKEIAAAIGNKRVILKPNNVEINRPLCATHADNLEGILEFLKSIGKSNVIIAESPASGSALDGFANYGYNKFAGQYGIKLVNLDTEGFEVVYCIDEKDFGRIPAVCPSCCWIRITSSFPRPSSKRTTGLASPSRSKTSLSARGSKTRAPAEASLTNP